MSTDIQVIEPAVIERIIPKMPVIIDAPQGSVEWLMARCGRITASRIVDVMTYLKKGGESAARFNYKVEILTERLTGLPIDTFVTKAMQWGTEMEPFARASYEMDTDLEVQQVGFGIHPMMDFAGASPDALVGDWGGLEIKCPESTTHIKWIIDGVVPEEHQPQCLFNMDVFNREWWDFMSYDPRVTKQKKFIVRMHRDEERIQAIRAEAVKFHGEIIDLTAQIGRNRLGEA